MEVFFVSFRLSDLLFMGEAALRTLQISVLAILFGTILGVIFGWMLHAGRWVAAATLGVVLDVFRSVPLLIQLILFFNLFPIIGFRLDPFAAGTIVLSLYTSALVANVVRGGIESVPMPMRRAARSLGMTYWQDMRHVVWPMGMRAVFPSWVGVALSVVKDSALVSAIGYVELIRASQLLVTRTQEPFIVFAVAAAFYFALSYPLARMADRVERSWKT
ncbi:MAG: amino acid ABC transporter permease [Gemmobacter sp.]